MKILHIIPSIDPKGGGPMEGVRQYGTRASAAGHQIEVLTLDAPTEPFLSDYPLPVHAIGPSKGRYRYNARLTGWLKQHARDYDAVIINGLWMYHGFGAWRALKDLKTPYFVFTHGMLDPWFKRTYPLKHLKKWLYWPWAEYRVLRDAKRVLFTCEQERILARQSFWLYKAKEAVVNYGAGRPADRDPAALRQAFFKRHPHLQGKRLVLFLSRIHVKKGCDLLLKAFAATAERDPQLHLVIAGPCADRYLQELQALSKSLNIEQRVSWLGMVKGDDKWGAFYAAEAFALPSHQENFGIAVAESLACGLPVLISDQVNIWREIVTDQAGFAAPDTLEGTIELFERWLSLSEAERSTMAGNAKRCFDSRFTADAMATSVTETIAQAIKS
ncbi:MAG TPA: glycosyltransferase [Aquabacterium sp.]|nr:glycosyltransferase [Aquabacterium sp.]